MNAVLKKPLISNEIVKRTPMPLVYEEACKALANVSTVLDAKYFADKADALAVWAKIYRSDEADLQSRRLKLHAFRKMGDLAVQMRPARKSLGTGGGSGSSPGAISLLVENGLRRGQASDALNISRLSRDKFDNGILKPRPPSVHQLAVEGRGNGMGKPMSSSAYRQIAGGNGQANGMTTVFCILRRLSVKDCALPVDLSELRGLCKYTTECVELLDVLDRRLQHAKSIAEKNKKKSK